MSAIVQEIIRSECVSLVPEVESRGGIVRLEDAIQMRDEGVLLHSLLWRRMFHTDQSIASVCEEISAMLVSKNIKYGNSALEPCRIFSTSAPDEQIKVRIDDKLNRIMKGSGDDEDTELDLIGYLVLLRVFGRNKELHNER